MWGARASRRAAAAPSGPCWSSPRKQARRKASERRGPRRGGVISPAGSFLGALYSRCLFRGLRVGALLVAGGEHAYLSWGRDGLTPRHLVPFGEGGSFRGELEADFCPALNLPGVNLPGVSPLG